VWNASIAHAWYHPPETIGDGVGLVVEGVVVGMDETLGVDEGCCVGLVDGSTLGTTLGTTLGSELGTSIEDGSTLGSELGVGDTGLVDDVMGADDGVSVGLVDVVVGLVDGVLVGVDDGMEVGMVDGVSVGVKFPRISRSSLPWLSCIVCTSTRLSSILSILVLNE